MFRVLSNLSGRGIDHVTFIGAKMVFFNLHEKGKLFVKTIKN